MGLNDRRKMPALPTVLLSNVQSIRNKLDELAVWASLKHEVKDTCLLAFTETWLSDLDRDENLLLTGFGAPFRLDRSPEITNKRRGGGVCFYVNQRYCNTVVVRERICTPDIELLTISLRPFYLPREFQQLFFTIVYIHPRANASAASQLIAEVTHRLDAICPDAPKFVLGDFNHCVLDKTLRTYEQYVTCATTHRNSTIDLCYGSVSGAYTSLPRPPLGSSYHNSVLLMPLYTPSFRRLPCEEKTVKCWSDDSTSALQACFECTDWQCFFDACGDNMNYLCDTVSSYVTFCVDAVIPSKKVVVYPNNKPWISKELKSVINRKKQIYCIGSALEKKAVSREVRNEIRKAKLKYKEKIEVQYSSGDLRAAWQGIKNMASINQHANETRTSISVNGVECSDLPNSFNHFFSRFESSDFSESISLCKKSLEPLNEIVISQECVTTLFKKVKIRKAAGPDAICGRTLHYCADQLSGVFTRLFQMCADLGQIPKLWKTSTIIPIPKSKNSKELKEFRPVALTSLVMKNFEKILKNITVSLIQDKLDPLQFAYQPKKGVEDAKIFIMDTVYKHLEKPKSHVRLLFADFSSAFNKMQPHILIERLSSYFNLPDQLLLLILNFLTERVQKVFVNGIMSTTTVSNTGSPQGCVLSPLLFIMYTDSCRTSLENRFLVKFSDDTVLLSLLQGSEVDHGPALPEFIDWCDENFLDLNVSKTKEMFIDFRHANIVHKASVIHGEDVQSVESYKYLGTVFDSQLKFDINTESIVKRGQQRIHLMRRLNSFNVSERILRNFYCSFIESLLTFSSVCWFNGLSIKDKNSLNSIVNVCSKIIGVKQRDLCSLWENQVKKKAKSILSQPDHVLSGQFMMMPSGRRYQAPVRRTNRYSRSFVPSAIRLLNADSSHFK